MPLTEARNNSIMPGSSWLGIVRGQIVLAVLEAAVTAAVDWTVFGARQRPLAAAVWVGVWSSAREIDIGR